MCKGRAEHEKDRDLLAQELRPMHCLLVDLKGHFP